MDFYQDVKKEIETMKMATSRQQNNKKPKLYKLLLLLAILDYFREETGDGTNCFNKTIKPEDILPYYKYYLFRKDIEKVTFNDKTNKQITNLIDLKKRDKKLLHLIKINPIRHIVTNSCIFDNNDNDKNSNVISNLPTTITLNVEEGIDQKRLYDILFETATTRLEKEIHIDLNSKDFKGRAYQHVYREKLLEKYNGSCAICDIDLIPVLVASHAKPFVRCLNIHEQISDNNGLLLCSNHDKMFDRGLISIDLEQQKIIYSNALTDPEIEKIKQGIEFKISKTYDHKMVKYFTFHKEFILQK